MLLLNLKKSKISTDIQPLGRVGIYTIFEDKDEDLLSDFQIKKVPDEIKFPLSYKCETDINKSINFGNKVLPKEFVTIAGPCSAENEDQVFSTAHFLKKLGVTHFRAGCYKPRTNAYSFQGLGRTGLELCREACDNYGMEFVSEVKDLSNVEEVLNFADVIQVGSKCMYDVGVLRELGRSKKPILLKRHFGATLKEFVQACDFILCEGNENVSLCERGIRTFEADTRFSLDSSGIEWLKKNSWLPIIGDPSHAMGYSYGVSGLSLAMIAQGISGLIIEVHPDPKLAMSDSSQQLTFDEFKELHAKVSKLSVFIKELYND